MIRIKSKKVGFRRCGIAHPAEFVEYPDDRFSKAEIAILKAEPMLIVEITKGKEKAPSDEYEAMTVDQIKEAISVFQPTQTLKDLKKAELIDILKAHKEASAGPSSKES